jgi:hypothetical protein
MKPCDLYRHFDKDDQLLYIGISYSTLVRMTQHRDISFWFDEVRKITIEKFNSRDAASKAEKIAIEHEKPKYNQFYNIDKIDIKNPNRPLGIYDIARLIGVSYHTIRKMKKANQLPKPFVENPGKWNAELVANWIATRRLTVT